MKANSQTSVAIVIPTRNRCVDLQHTLETVIAQDYPAGLCDIFAVDDGSTDDTPGVIERLQSSAVQSGKSLQRLASGGRGTNAAVNLGIAASGSDVIITMGDDTGTPEGWLKKIIAGLIESKADAVSGPMRIATPGPLLGKHREEIQPVVTEVTGPCYWEHGQMIPVAGNMAVWRRVFDRALFDETLVPPVEEVDWALRANVRTEFVEDAWVWHCKGPESFGRNWILRKVWRQGIVTGSWVRDSLRWSFSKRLSAAFRCLSTALRASLHALFGRCWGGAVVALGEFSRALALVGLLNRESQKPKPRTWQNAPVLPEPAPQRSAR